MASSSTNVSGRVFSMPHIFMFATGPSDASYSSIYTYTAAILIETLLYGIYSALFVVCMYVLASHRKTTQKVMLGCAIFLYAMATIDMVLAVSYLYTFVLKNIEIPDDNVHFKYLIYITSNCVADALLIYRCYTAWGNSKRIIIIPCLMLLAGSACGYTFIGLSEQEYRFRLLLRSFLFITLTLNILVTALMAGRIWWIGRQARSILGPGLSRKYYRAIAILVESGFIYAVYVVVDVILQLYPLDAGLCQVVGIVPTLIIVQIGLGRTTRDADTNSGMRTEIRDTTTCEPEEFSPLPTIPQVTQLPRTMIMINTQVRCSDSMQSEYDPPPPMTPMSQFSRSVVDVEPKEPLSGKKSPGNAPDL